MPDIYWKSGAFPDAVNPLLALSVSTFSITPLSRQWRGGKVTVTLGEPEDLPV